MDIDSYLEVKFSDNSALSRLKDGEAALRAMSEIETLVKKMGGTVEFEKCSGFSSLTFNDTRDKFWFSLSVTLSPSRLREHFAKSISANHRSVDATGKNS